MPWRGFKACEMERELAGRFGSQPESCTGQEGVHEMGPCEHMSLNPTGMGKSLLLTQAHCARQCSRDNWLKLPN